jgi:trimeric autotransporter adhesin
MPTARGGTADPILLQAASNGQQPLQTRMGFRAVATALRALVIGANAKATATEAIAIGNGASAATAPQASAQGAIAVGASDGVGPIGTYLGARASGTNSVAIGTGSLSNGSPGAAATGNYGVAIGIASIANSSRSIAVGYTSSGSAIDAIAVGGVALASITRGVALGANAQATTGAEAIAIGSGTNTTAAPLANAQGAIAIGASDASGVAGARASAVNSVAIGSGDGSAAGASATGTKAVALGYNTVSSPTFGVAIGSSASTVNTGGIAIGSTSDISSTSNYATAIGTNAQCSAAIGGIAIGGGSGTNPRAQASAEGAVAIGASNSGNGARASGTAAIALGGGNGALAGANASGTSAVALGQGAGASHNYATAIGNGAATTAANQIRLGTSSEDVNIPGTLTLSGGAVTPSTWVGYTPTLDQSGAVTKTVDYARYTRIGKLIIVNFHLTVTGTGIAANTVTVSLPVTAVVSGLPVVGAGVIFDTSAGVRYPGIAALNATTTCAFLLASENNQNAFLGSVTFSAALASGDTITGHLTYEAA